MIRSSVRTPGLAAVSSFLRAHALLGVPLLLAACGAASTPPAGGTGTGSSVSGTTGSGATLSADQQQMLNLANAARAQGRQCGDTAYPAAGALRWDSRLAASAHAYNQDMIQGNFFHEDHSGSGGSTPQSRMAAAGYDIAGAGGEVGENIAAGSSFTLQSVFDAWIASPGHCQNLMNPDYRDFGMAVDSGANTSYGTYFTQDFGVLGQ